jgi:ASC-1-like (ASCH) protein
MTYLSEAANPKSLIGLHLAVFSEPFLSFVLDGRKTVESRFSRARRAPFGAVSEGDIILIKEVAGPVCGIALAKQAWYYDLTRVSLHNIRERYGMTICADNDFWDSRRDANYGTLIELAEVSSISAFDCDKRDRRGWVPLRSRQLFLDL